MSEQLLSVVFDAVEEKKALDPIVLDIRGISLIADYFIICHGNSETQVQSIVNEIRKQADKHKYRIKGVEGLDKSRWVLIDLGDVVVHVFHREDREYYNIERLWSDAKVVEKV